MPKQMNRVGYVIVLAATCAITPLTSFAENELPDELLRCSTIEDSSARVGCFDAFMSRREPTEKAPIESEPQVQKAPDDLGSENLPPEARGDEEKLFVRATVTSCQKDALGKYLFFFDNGHVWKQSNTKRLRFDKCEFDVTITEDVFGYRMQRVGEKGQIRIARVR